MKILFHCQKKEAGLLSNRYQTAIGKLKALQGFKIIYKMLKYIHELCV